MRRHNPLRRFAILAFVSLTCRDVLVSFAAANEHELIVQFCVDCHGDDRPEAGIGLAGDSSQIGLLKQRKLWLRALDQIRSGDMPPADADQWTSEQRSQVVDWLDGMLHPNNWHQFADPGRQSLSRLTTIEYRNSVRDIFKVDLHAGVYLGRDPEGATGFTNDRDNLSFPLFGMQDYLREAERAVDAFLGYGEPRWSNEFDLVEAWQRSSDKSTSLTTDGNAVLADDSKKPFHFGVTVPHAGKYRIATKAASVTAGASSGIEVLVNGRVVGRFLVDEADFETYDVVAILPAGFSTVSLVWSPDLTPDYGAVPTPPHLEERARKSGPLPQFPIPDRLKMSDEAIKAFRRFNKTLVDYECDRRLARLLIERNATDYNRNSFLNFRQNSAPFNLSAGKIAVLLNVPQKQLEKQLQQDLGFDRNEQRSAARDYKKALAAKHPELVKPSPRKIGMASVAISSHALEPNDSDPAWVFTTPNNRDGASTVLKRIATAAYGESLSSQQLSSLIEIYLATIKETGDHNDGLRDALVATLMAPKFLLRYTESTDDPLIVLDSHALASRLAAFLWLSIPDAKLREMAESDDLTEPQGLDAALEHLITDDRFDSFCATFMEQWLDLDSMKGLNPTLSAAMRAEPALLLREIFREDRSILDLLDARHTWLNESLADHYEIDGVTGHQMRPVPLHDDRRGGLLAMGGMLTVTSTEQRTSPVARGAWIVETLLGVELPPPPPSVPELKPQAKVRTIREELELHRSATQCAGCHQKIDPYGFVLENYNRFGIWRDKEGLKRVNARTTLDDGTRINGLAEFKLYLREKRSRDFARNLTERMLRFALGRDTHYYDEQLVQHIVAELEANRWRAQVLLREIVRSDAFRHQNNSVAK